MLIVCSSASCAVSVMALPWSVPAACSSCSVSDWWADQPGLLPSMTLCSSQPPPFSPASYTTLSTRYTGSLHTYQPHTVYNNRNLMKLALNSKGRIAQDWLQSSILDTFNPLRSTIKFQPFLSFPTSHMCRTKAGLNWSYKQVLCVPPTHKWATLLHWVTSSFISMSQSHIHLPAAPSSH